MFALGYYAFRSRFIKDLITAFILISLAVFHNVIV